MTQARLRPIGIPRAGRARLAAQQPVYGDRAALETAVAQLSQLPPLVTTWEIENLKEQLAAAQRGEAFLLQGGDCAETFEECTSDNIVQKLKILLQMSLVMLMGLKKPIIRVGRMAGQYAKPRSADFETKDGVSLPSYRGDIINRMPFTAADREPDPALMLRGYERAALTLNFVRSLIDGGFADLHHPENWDLEVRRRVRARGGIPQARASRCPTRSSSSRRSAASRCTARTASSSTRRTKGCTCRTSRRRRASCRTGSAGTTSRRTIRGSACARRISRARTSSTSAASRIRWRSRSARGVATSSSSSSIHVLNPNNEPGRLTFITRFGAKNIDAHLPRVIRAVRATGSRVLWVCDPMHGNTETTAEGVKTRRFDNIRAELRSAFRIHQEQGSYLGGVHLELTGDNVTECIGGARGLKESDLARAYKSTVDPRLNYEQAMEIAMLIGGRLRTHD